MDVDRKEERLLDFWISGRNNEKPTVEISRFQMTTKAPEEEGEEWYTFEKVPSFADLVAKEEEERARQLNLLHKQREDLARWRRKALEPIREDLAAARSRRRSSIGSASRRMSLKNDPFDALQRDNEKENLFVNDVKVDSARTPKSKPRPSLASPPMSPFVGADLDTVTITIPMAQLIPPSPPVSPREVPISPVKPCSAVLVVLEEEEAGDQMPVIDDITNAVKTEEVASSPLEETNGNVEEEEEMGIEEDATPPSSPSFPTIQTSPPSQVAEPASSPAAAVKPSPRAADEEEDDEYDIASLLLANDYLVQRLAELEAASSTRVLELRQERDLLRVELRSQEVKFATQVGRLRDSLQAGLEASTRRVEELEAELERLRGGGKGGATTTRRRSSKRV